MSCKDHTELIAFKQHYGIASSTRSAQLEGRITAQHNNHLNLQMDRQDALRSIGDVRQENFCNDRWEESFRMLSELFTEHGRAFKPDKNSVLGLWTAQQSKLHSRGLLHPDRKDQLDDIGFSWTPFERFLDCAVPSSADNGTCDKIGWKN
jgi:hypothetical protein